MSKPREHLYDEECFRLAEYFLDDEPIDAARRYSLAEAIQTAVEDWFAANPIEPAQEARDENA